MKTSKVMKEMEKRRVSRGNLMNVKTITTAQIKLSINLRVCVLSGHNTLI